MSLKKILVVGRMYSRTGSINGPAAVIKAIIEEFEKKKIDYELIDYDDAKISKLKYLTKIMIKIILNKNCIVNVHTEGYFIPILIMVISKFKKSHEYFLTVHGIVSIESKFINHEMSKKEIYFEKVLFKKFPNLVCVSEKLKIDIKKYFGREEKVYVINNGIYIDKDAFSNICFKNNEIALITTGGIKRRKGIFESLEFMNILNNKRKYNTILYIYGSFDDEETLKIFNERVKKYNLNERVIYKGIIKEKDELYKKYGEAHLNLCLSHYDTFNVAALESMAVGTPSIVSVQCGAAYLINNYYDGFKIDMEKDYIEDLLKILDYVIDNSEKYFAIRKNSFENVKKYSWSKTAEEYVNLFYK